MNTLYRNSSSWISEWATQVAKHNCKSNPEKQCPAGLPTLPLGKHQDGRFFSLCHGRLKEFDGTEALIAMA
jgi:hypothetical protein